MYIFPYRSRFGLVNEGSAKTPDDLRLTLHWTADRSPRIL
jgi:hypothetical protein